MVDWVTGLHNDGQNSLVSVAYCKINGQWGTIWPVQIKKYDQKSLFFLLLFIISSILTMLQNDHFFPQNAPNCTIFPYMSLLVLCAWGNHRERLQRPQSGIPTEMQANWKFIYLAHFVTWVFDFICITVDQVMCV